VQLTRGGCRGYQACVSNLLPIDESAACHLGTCSAVSTLRRLLADNDSLVPGFTVQVVCHDPLLPS
jgi:hypothetical protein